MKLFDRHDTAFTNPDECPAAPVKLHFSDFKPLFLAKNISKGAGEVPLIIYGLDRRNGRALKRIKPPAQGGFLDLQPLEYSELIHTAQKAGKDLSGLTPQNWYEYCILRPGDVIMFAGESSGTGPYHDETRYGLYVNENGYFLKCSSGSPSAGMSDHSQHLPIGFFAGKTIDQIRDFIFASAAFVSTSLISISDRDLELLIETDQYKMRL